MSSVNDDSEGAGAATTGQQPLLDQPLDRLAHGDARDAIVDRQIAFGGDRVAARNHLTTDRIADELLQLQVERRGIVGAETPYPAHETHHRLPLPQTVATFGATVRGAAPAAP
jgi:hypothetical protein